MRVFRRSGRAHTHTQEKKIRKSSVDRSVNRLIAANNIKINCCGVFSACNLANDYDIVFREQLFFLLSSFLLLLSCFFFVFVNFAFFLFCHFWICAYHRTMRALAYVPVCGIWFPFRVHNSVYDGYAAQCATVADTTATAAAAFSLIITIIN